MSARSQDTHLVRVRTPRPECLLRLFPGEVVHHRDTDPELVTVTGHTAKQIAQLAAAYQIPLYELTPLAC